MRLAPLLATVGLTAATPALADEELEACLGAFDRAQTHRAAGELLRAREALVACAQAECPAPMTQQCTTWHGEVERDLPGFVVEARDGDGQEVADVEVFAGDTRIAGSLDGRELRLDPGEHHLRFVRRGVAPVDKTVLLRVGERRRRVTVRFAGAAAPAPEPAAADHAASWEPSPLLWAGGAITLAGLVVGGVAGGVAMARGSELEEQCATRCTQEEIDDAAISAHVSTAGFVAAGIGAALLVVGVILGGEPDAARLLRPAGLQLSF